MTESVLEKLNTAQLEAVSRVEGPMMIIAGAGTGKTRVITSRILHLILNKKVPASRILALTFTEKAADEMLARVDETMPLSYEGVTIKTFHGFCDQILRERGIEIGLDPGFMLIDQARQWLTIKNNLFDFELDYYRPLGNPNKFINVLLNHFSRLKDEDISPEKYLAYAENLNGEDADKTLEIARAYAKYQEILVKNNYLDFGDLQYYALRLLEKCPSVLREYQDRYKYILVDEFQDTNYAQNKLVMMLAREHKNLTAVGDDDQSIYKWRGASLCNLMAFEKDFPDVKKVVLTENYRSSQKILDLSYSIIQNNNPERLEHKENINKKLVSKADAEDSNTEVWHFNHYLEEVNEIMAKIKDIVKDGADYNEIAILVRANQHAHPYMEALKDDQIPYSVRDTQSITRFEEIKDVLVLLKFIHRPHDDVAFVRLMSLLIFDIPMSEILNIVQKAKKDDYKAVFYYLRDYYSSAGQAEIPGIDKVNEAVFDMYKFFVQMLDFSRSNRISRIIGEFLDKSGYYKSLADNEDQNAEKLQRIAQLLEITHDFEGENADIYIKVFLEFLDSMEEARGLVSTAEFADKNAVSVLTVHSAKGLEFDHVFIPSMVAQRFPSTNRRDPIEIPAELIEEDIPESETNIYEERRLFYVACTRAKKNLYLSYSDKYEGNKKWKSSPFILEAIRSGYIDERSKEELRISAPDASGQRAHAGLVREQKKDSGLEQKIYSVPEVNVNQLSYSRIDTFKTCPLKYKFRYLFNIPTPSPHAANFGSSVHDAVNLYYKRLQDGIEPSLDLLKELYDKCWIGHGYESKAHENARKKKGLEMMESFYAIESFSGFKIPAFMEKNFRLKIGAITFTGRIDRIDRLDDGTYEVIDYKTGTSKRNINLKKDMQLSLYALACRDVYKIPVSSLSLYYLEDGEKASTVRADKDLEELKDVLIETSSELKNSDFKPTPGFHCGFCEYKILCNAAE